MALFQLILHNFFSFIFIISLIVFIHEFGHFFVARLCGVKVDEFAIGFGRELFGFNDKKGTRWKICLWPLGGYVKMYGDKNGASMPDAEAIANMSEDEKKISFVGKNVWQRMAIVIAGPIANFVLAIFIFTILFRLNGLNTVLPVIDEVFPESAAFESGLKKGDKILAIDGNEISDFNDVRIAVITSLSDDLVFKIQREISKNEKIFEVKIAPKIQTRKDFFGDEVKMKTLGVSASAVSHQDLNLGQSFIRANIETYQTSVAILKALGELITGKRSVAELGGPIKIAKYSGKTVDMGITSVLWFMAMISVNLGVMNLLPVPVLDGGHLFFYIIEAIFRKPLSQKVQKIGFQFGMSLVLALMIFTTINDVRQLLN
jgi:regulator of sigma E protease